MATQSKGAKRATRRASTAKAKAKAAQAKATPAKRTAAKAKAKAQPKAQATTKAASTKGPQLFKHWPDGTSPYAFNVIPGNPERGAKGAVIVAAFIATGYAQLAAKGQLLTKGKGGNAALLRKIVGQTAYSHHAKAGRIDHQSETLNAAGLNWFNARLAGLAPINNTDVDTVRAVVTAMTKGGKAAGLIFETKVSA